MKIKCKRIPKVFSYGFAFTYTLTKMDSQLMWLEDQPQDFNEKNLPEIRYDLSKCLFTYDKLAYFPFDADEYEEALCKLSEKLN